MLIYDVCARELNSVFRTMQTQVQTYYGSILNEKTQAAYLSPPDIAKGAYFHGEERMFCHEPFSTDIPLDRSLLRPIYPLDRFGVRRLQKSAD